MRLLTRYIGKTILSTTLVVLVVIVAMGFFVQFVGELNDIGKGNYGLLEAMRYVLLNLPRIVYEFFPMAGLIGGLLGLGLLASNSELVVMRTSGISVARISWSVVQTILALVIVFTVLGETFAPRALLWADQGKALAKSGGQALATQHGVWIRDGKNFIHIETVSSGGKLSDVTRYMFADNQVLHEIAHAKTGQYIDEQWQMQGIDISIIKGDTVSTEKEKSAVWDMTLNPTILKVAQVDPEEMSLGKLHSVISYRDKNNLNADKFKLQFWQRIFQPIATCVMMFLALPFIFGPLRQATMGLRIIAGVVVGFGFYIISQSFGPFTLVYQLPPILGASLPTIIFALAGLLLMRRAK